MIHQRNAMVNQDKILDRWHPVFDLKSLINTNLSGRYFIPDLNKLTVETNEMKKDFEPFSRLPALFIDSGVAEKGTFGILDVKIQSVLEDNLSELHWRDTKYASDYPTGRKYIRGIRSTDIKSEIPSMSNEYFGISGKENYSILGFSRQSGGYNFTNDNERFKYGIEGANNSYAYDYTGYDGTMYIGNHDTNDVLDAHIFKDTNDRKIDKSKVHSLIVKYTLYTSDGKICSCNFKVDDIILYFYYGWNRIYNNMKLDYMIAERDKEITNPVTGEPDYVLEYEYRGDAIENYSEEFFNRYKMNTNNPINNHYNDEFGANYFPTVGDTSIKRYPYLDIFLANASYVKESLLVDIDDDSLNMDTDIIFKDIIPYTPKDYLTDDPIKMCQLIYHTGYTSTAFMDLMESHGMMEYRDVTLIQKRYADITNRLAHHEITADEHTDVNSLVYKMDKMKDLLIAGNELYIRFCKKYNLNSGINNNMSREEYIAKVNSIPNTSIKNPAKDTKYFPSLLGSNIFSTSNQYVIDVRRFVKDLASRPRLCLFFTSAIVDRENANYYTMRGIKENFINREEIRNKEGIYNFDRNKIITRAIYKAPQMYAKISPMGDLWDNIYLHTATYNQGNNTTSERIYGEYPRITGSPDYTWLKSAPSRTDVFNPARYWREYEDMGQRSGKYYIGEYRNISSYKINDFGNQNVYYFHADLQSINFEYRRSGSYFYTMLKGPYVSIEPKFTSTINNNIPYYDTHGLYYNKNYNNDYKPRYENQVGMGNSDFDMINATGWYYPTTDYATHIVVQYPCVDWYTYPWADKSGYPDRLGGTGIFKGLGRYKYIYARRNQSTPDMYKTLSKFNFMTLRNPSYYLGSNMNLDAKRWIYYYKYENNTMNLDERYGLYDSIRLTK